MRKKGKDDPQNVQQRSWAREQHAYWGTWNWVHQFQRSFGRHLFVRQNVYWPYGLTADYSTEKCTGQKVNFFSAKASYHGSSLDRIFKSLIPYSLINQNHPFAKTLYENRIYWTDQTQKGYMMEVSLSLMGIKCINPKLLSTSILVIDYIYYCLHFALKTLSPLRLKQNRFVYLQMNFIDKYIFA